MAKQKVIIRVDGNSNIGLGHIYRGIALSEMLKNNFNVQFLTKHNSTTQPIIDANIKYSLLPSSLNFEEEPNWIKQNIENNAIIILDGYQFKENYQKNIKQLGFKLVYIDDLVEGTQYADLVINHSPGVNKSNYKTESYTKLAVGLDYALLRQSFINFDRSNTKSNTEIKNILVSFGGADPEDFTYKIVAELLKIETLELVNVILGSAYKHTKINDLKSDKIKLYKNLSEKEVFKIMTETDLAVVPASTTLFELFAVETPAISGYYVENQKVFYNYLLENDMILGVGDFHDFKPKELKKILLYFNNNNKTVIDGNQNMRILQLFKKL